MLSALILYYLVFLKIYFGVFQKDIGLFAVIIWRKIATFDNASAAKSKQKQIGDERKINVRIYNFFRF